MLKRLHPLFDEDGAIGAESGVESTPAAEVNTQVDESQTGVDTKDAADPEKQNNYEKAFAKRLAAERDKWEKDTGEKYKDYDTLKKTASYFQQRHGYTDLMVMNEDIELAELQDRAAKENVPPEVLKRIDQLETEAAEGKVLKEQNEQQKQYQEFRSNLDKFATEKQANADELHKYMYENQFPADKIELAYKAMISNEAVTKLATAKEDAIKEYLDSKKGPKVEGAPGTASVQSVDTRKMTWDQLDKHVLERVKAASTPQ